MFGDGCRKKLWLPGCQQRGSKIYRFAWEFLLRHLVMEKRESERAVDFREAFQGEGIPLLGWSPFLEHPKRTMKSWCHPSRYLHLKKISKPVSHRIWEKLLEKPRAEYRQVNQFSVVSHHFHDSNDRIFAKILLKATTKNWFGLSWNFQSCKGLNFRFPTSMERRIVVPIIFIYVLETFGKRTIIPIIFTYFQSVSIMFQWFSPVLGWVFQHLDIFGLYFWISWGTLVTRQDLASCSLQDLRRSSQGQY